MPLPNILRSCLMALVALLALNFQHAAWAQPQGGLYIAGAGFSFNVAAERGLAQNPDGRRFFLLVLPPETDALLQRANPAQTALRERVVAGNGALLVCQRDIDNGRIRRADLTPGVVVARGWPAPGSNELPAGRRYFADENPAMLPAANEALRMLRSTCT